MHPAVYMTLTKVLIKSDARHSLLLDPTGQHLAVFCYIHKNIAVLIFYYFFLTFHFFLFHRQTTCVGDGWRQPVLLNAYVSCHNANVSLM